MKQYPLIVYLQQFRRLARRWFLLVFLAGAFVWCVCLPAVAQTVNIMRDVIPPSPDAAGLGKYGLYPVTLSNGLVNISIPIYSIKTASIEMPISLSYHAAGIKVDEVASCVGVGLVLKCRRGDHPGGS